MGIDIRFPIGLMFSILGLLLTVFGLFTMGNQAVYERSLGININLLSGLVMLLFGLIMLFLSLKGRKKSQEKDGE